MRMIKFVLLSLLVVTSVEAGRDLMIRECNNVDTPTVCMQCLESDPASVQADSVGIARIVINCLDFSLHILSDVITRKLPLVKDEAVKEALKECKREMSDAIKTLKDAKKGLKTRDYDKAGHSVAVALQFPLTCKSKLMSAQNDDLIYDLLIDYYGSLSNAAMRIIDRF